MLTPAKSQGTLAARLDRLRRRAARADGVGVEHLLPFALLGDPAAAAPLREIAAEHHWPVRGRLPLGAWAEAIATYLERGVAALLRRTAREEPFVTVSLLEIIHTQESTAALLTLANRAEKAGDRALLSVTLTALNTLLVSASPTDAQVRAARSLAHRILRRKLAPSDAFDCYCILELVGDARSLALIEARPPLTGDYAGEDKRVIRSLQRALARSARSAR